MEWLAELVLELLLLAVVFTTLEWCFRGTPAPAWFRRSDAKTDVGFYVLNSTVAGTFEALGVMCVVAAAAMLGGATLAEVRDLLLSLVDSTESSIGPAVLREQIDQLPLWLQALLGILIADFIYYWGHRIFHKRPFWRFHAVHHSPVQLDWLSSVRSHPLEDAAMSVLQVVPLLFLGFSAEVFVVVTPAIAVWSVFTHANVTWDFGPLKYLPISPRFHRWHHTSEEEGLDKNFAGVFPFYDLLFGTWYMPDRVPTVFGTGNKRVPAGLWQQLMYPFRQTSRADDVNGDGESVA